MTVDLLADVRDILRPLRDQPAWGTALVGPPELHVLTTNFGPSMVEAGQTYGEHHLRVTTAAWRLEQGREVIVSCGDDDLPGLISVLDGRSVVDITIKLPSLSTVFTFTRDLSLRAFAVCSEGAEHWELFVPSGDVFTAGPGPCWSLQAAAAAGTEGARRE